MYNFDFIPTSLCLPKKPVLSSTKWSCSQKAEGWMVTIHQLSAITSHAACNLAQAAQIDKPTLDRYVLPYSSLSVENSKFTGASSKRHY